jgi:hypothetical protein
MYGNRMLGNAAQNGERSKSSQLRLVITIFAKDKA